MTDKLSKAGDVSMRDISIISSTGNSYNIKEQVLALEIYEDLFGSFITGTIIVRDSMEFKNLIPLIGEEILLIDVITPLLDEQYAYKGEFYIYKMDDIVVSADRETTYMLHFISKEAIIDANCKISQAFSGKISDIVENLITGNTFLDSKKDYNIEPSSNSTKYVSNYWSPIQNLQYCCEHALNGNNSPTYIFYENKHGLNFLTFDALYTSNPLYQRFVFDNKTYTPDQINQQYSQIQEYRQEYGFDYLSRIRSGLYASETIYYDTLAKRYVHKSYIPEFKDTSHLNDYPIWTENIKRHPRSLLNCGTINYNTHDGFGDATNVKFSQHRSTLLAQAESYRLTIEVLGRTDYTVGQKVYVDIPLKTQITNETDHKDIILSGVYLIAAINHNIKSKGHICIIELIKDSLITNLSYEQFPN